MAEHYDAKVLERTAGLYGKVVEWARDRDDVTVIGGWAVYELVAAGKAMQSRDVDLVLHTEDALTNLLSQISGWDLKIRSIGRKTFPDAHFKDEPPTAFRLDLFTSSSNRTWQRKFGMQGAANIKSAPRALYPDLEWTIRDKLATLHLRTGPDREDKRAKDCIDLMHLVFHNTEGVSARHLANSIDASIRGKAVQFLDSACKVRPAYREDLGDLQEWLEAPNARKGASTGKL